MRRVNRTDHVKAQPVGIHHLIHIDAIIVRKDCEGVIKALIAANLAVLPLLCPLEHIPFLCKHIGIVGIVIGSVTVLYGHGGLKILIHIGAYNVRSFAQARHRRHTHIKAVVILPWHIYRSVRACQRRKRLVLIGVVSRKAYRPVIKQSHTPGGNLCGIARAILGENLRINQSVSIQLVEPLQPLSRIVLY